LYDSTNEGMNFSGNFGSASTIWYPASGYRSYGGGLLGSVGFSGNYWSASPDGDLGYSNLAYYLIFYGSGYVTPADYYHRASGYSVRCLQE
jgi:hypothetical protein